LKTDGRFGWDREKKHYQLHSQRTSLFLTMRNKINSKARMALFSILKYNVSFQNVFRCVIQWKPINVVTLGLIKSDNINRMITITSELNLLIYSKWHINQRLQKCDFHCTRKVVFVLFLNKKWRHYRTYISLYHPDLWGQWGYRPLFARWQWALKSVKYI